MPPALIRWGKWVFRSILFGLIFPLTGFLAIEQGLREAFPVTFEPDARYGESTRIRSSDGAGDPNLVGGRDAARIAARICSRLNDL